MELILIIINSLDLILNNNTIEVFLGELIPLLKVKYFNPVVKEWNEALLKIEYEKK